MPAIQISNIPYDYMITIACFKELGGKDFVTATEVTNVRRCSSETNKLMYTPYLYAESPGHQGTKH